MAFSQILDFLKILSKSMNLVSKNGKSIASITTVSLLQSSLIISFYTYGYQLTLPIIINHASSSNYLLLILFLLLTLTFLIAFAYVLTIHASVLATVLASTTSYTGNILSLHDLFSLLKSRWRNPYTNKYSGGSRNPMPMLWIIETAVAIPVAMIYPNPVTTTIASGVCVSFYVFVVGAKAVIRVVEEEDDGSGCEAAEAVVEGRRVQGLMLNLLFNVVVVVIWLSFWWNVGDKRSVGLMVYGLFYVNCVSIFAIIWSVVYTAYYFHCVEYHGQTIQLFGNLNAHYTTLPSDHNP